MPGRSLKHLFITCWMILLPAIAFCYQGDTADAVVEPMQNTDVKVPLPPSLEFRSKPREVRNYIRPTISLSIFNTGSRRTRGNVPFLNNRLGDYQYFQSSLSFYAPLYTKTKFYGGDSTRIKTFHLLFTVNAVTDRPSFSELPKQHELYKLAIGVRGIWTKKRGVFFADITPFAAGDKYNEQQTARVRLGTTFVYNHMVKPWFSWRIGITKTFLYGNKLFLPMIGFRLGRLDGDVYLQAQFPRHVSLTIQPSPKFSINIYSRAYGGVYNISNEDSLYIGNDSVIHFGHFGIANGVRFDFRPNPSINFFISGGLAMQNYIWLYSYSFNQQNNLAPFDPFYKARPAPTMFLNFGCTIRFGKAKRSQGNYLMYDAFDLNNQMDPGDNGNYAGSDIPKAAEEAEMSKVQYKDVEDLVDETDLY